MLSVSLPETRTKDVFLSALEQSGLLTPRHWDLMRGQFEDPSKSVAEIVEFAIHRELLTRFQTDRLIKGQTNGLIIGSYVVLDLIAAGRGSRIYRARHRTMNRIVALKIFSTARSQSARLRTQFETASRTAVQLIHPHIVTTFDANHQADRLYTVLEYVPGISLESFVVRNHPLPISLVIEWTRQLANALAYTHARGAVHGWLNPENILVVANPNASDVPTLKILNFGFGQIATFSSTAATQLLDGAMAAADYLAPEQLEPECQATPASDLFSLGCLVHYLLTSRAPSSDGPIHQQSLHHGVERWRPGLSMEFISLVNGLLQNDPSRRPSRASDIVETMARFSRSADQLELAMPAVNPESVPESPFAGFDSEDHHDRFSARSSPDMTAGRHLNRLFSMRQKFLTRIMAVVFVLIICFLMAWITKN